MFLTLARIYAGYGAELQSIQQLPAAQLSRWLDEIWFHKDQPAAGFPSGDDALNDLGRVIEEIRVALGHPPEVPPSDQGIAPSGLRPPDVGSPGGQDRTAAPFTLRPGPLQPPGCGPSVWEHLIYAYLVESTGALDVFAEVARRLVAGETLGVLSRESIVWLRNTEELFFRDPPLFAISGLVSDLRPSRSVNRRNVYWRLFGMDLPHQIPPGWPGSGLPEDWKANTSTGVNTDFQEKLIELLRQVWLGIINRNNSTGANPTDPAYVGLLCQAIGDLLRNRRQNGLLAREEFVYTSTLSWFHLTLLDNSPILADLQVQGSAPEQRLGNLAQKVGMKAADRSRELFQLCERMSILLRSIELGAYDAPDQAELLFTDPATVEEMRLIVNLWQSATGQRIKDQDAVAAVPQPGQPIRTPTPAATTRPPNGTAATNGARVGSS